MKNRRTIRWMAALALGAGAVGAQATELRVEIGGTRSTASWETTVEQAVKSYARRTAQLTKREREARKIKVQFSLPLRVVLTQNGQPLPVVATRSRAPEDIVPTFDATGSRAFSEAYRQHLEATFTQARPVMNSVFGIPKTPGAVRIKNYDADIQDRLAVSGGYYVPNAPTGPEIRFPVYNSSVAASINYIHCLLLAYQGTTPYFADAFNEGIVRAATMSIVRTAGSLPNSPSSDQVEATLDSLYDVTAFYDWYNQPGLGAQPFIAPNLLSQTLPPGGSTGGAFLLRYQMAGSAWSKVLTEYPGFANEFNKRYYASPAIYQNEAALVDLGQDTINFLSGGGTATVEGLPFAAWVERQSILDTSRTPGNKVVVQPFPIAPISGSSDFGVFGLIINAWRTLPNGDETLLSGQCYPIFWRPDDVRFFTSTQEDVVGITGAYGSAAPNFPGDNFGNQKYRVTVDAPFQGQIARAYIPAGAVATGANTTENNFYGTLVGLPAVSGSTSYRIQVDWTGGSNTSITAQNFAFGARITDASFDRAQMLTVKVFRVQGATVNEVISRRVAKGQGPIALDLRPSNAETSYTFSRQARLSFFGLPIQPYRPLTSTVLAQTESETLAASYNPSTGKYELYPDEGRLTHGLGAFIRPSTAQSVTVRGRTSPSTLMTVHLRPGWNAITSPFTTEVPFTQVNVTSATESLSTWTEAQGTILGTTIFAFQGDSINMDSGTFQPATSFKPGQAVYVRALRAEGAVLVFHPSALPTSNDIANSNIVLERPLVPVKITLFGEKYRPKATSQWNFTPRRWEAQVTVKSPSFVTSTAIIGQASNGSKGFDPSEDAELPPFVSPGFQASIVNGQGLFKDIRVYGIKETFTVKLDGLIVGQQYRVTLDIIAGSPALKIYDPTTRQTETVQDGMTFTFNAIAPTQTFDITSGGIR